MLKVSNLSYGSVLKGINLSLPLNSNIAITGPLGSGKSTLLNCLSGVEGRYSGKVIYNSIDLRDIDSFFRKAAIVMQNPENQLVTDSALNELVFTLENMSVQKRDIDDKLEVVLNLFGHKDFFRGNPFINTLSGGEKQLLVILSELIKDPDYIFLDDAFSMIDSEKKESILAYFKKSNTSLFYTTNDIETAMLADYIIILNHEKNIFSKRTLEITEDEWLRLHKSIGIDIPVKIMKKILLKA